MRIDELFHWHLGHTSEPAADSVAELWTLVPDECGSTR